MSGIPEFGDPNPNYSPTGTMPRLNSIRRVVNREGFRTLTALLNGLIGAASGSNVTATRRRVQAIQATSGPENNGGARPVELTTVINRNTTAADVTALKAFLVGVTVAPNPYPTNGNGLNQKQF